MKRHQFITMTVALYMAAVTACGEDSSATATPTPTTQSSAAAASAKIPTPTTQPSAAAAPAAVTQPKVAPVPEPAPKLLATVGKYKITTADIDKVLDQYRGQIPPDQMAEARKSLLDRMIKEKQIMAFFKLAPSTKAEVDAWKKKVDEQLKVRGIKMSVDEFLASRGITDAQVRELTLQEKLMAKFKAEVQSVVTTVRASHILIAYKPEATDAEKAKAKEKLKGIAKEIADGKITFADAAKKHSDCPSKAKGGDLDVFPYGAMAKPFSEAAFAMKVGQVSDLVETQFGVHLIKLTARTEGTGKAEAGGDRREAEGKLIEAKKEAILDAAAKAFPAVIVGAKPAAATTKPDAKPTDAKPVAATTQPVAADAKPVAATTQPVAADAKPAAAPTTMPATSK